MKIKFTKNLVYPLIFCLVFIALNMFDFGSYVQGDETEQDNDTVTTTDSEIYSSGETEDDIIKIYQVSDFGAGDGIDDCYYQLQNDLNLSDPIIFTNCTLDLNGYDIISSSTIEINEESSIISYGNIECSTFSSYGNLSIDNSCTIQAEIISIYKSISTNASLCCNYLHIGSGYSNLSAYLYNYIDTGYTPFISACECSSCDINVGFSDLNEQQMTGQQCLVTIMTDDISTIHLSLMDIPSEYSVTYKLIDTVGTTKQYEVYIKKQEDDEQASNIKAINVSSFGENASYTAYSGDKITITISDSNYKNFSIIKKQYDETTNSWLYYIQATNSETGLNKITIYTIALSQE